MAREKNPFGKTVDVDAPHATFKADESGAANNRVDFLAREAQSRVSLEFAARGRPANHPKTQAAPPVRRG